jgi:hypothetical protein
MEDHELSREDIRKLLEAFGSRADQAIVRYLEQHPEAGPLKLRVVLEDLTDYGEFQPTDPLKLQVEGEIRR